MAHPHDQFVWESGEQAAGIDDSTGGSTEFPGVGRVDVGSELSADHLHSVADAENGNPQVEQFGVGQWCVIGVDACGASRENQSAGIDFLDAFDREVVSDHPAKDVLFSNASSDQLSGLGAEVENQDLIVIDRLSGAGHWTGLIRSGGGIVGVHRLDSLESWPAVKAGQQLGSRQSKPPL